jgi:DNA repair photolyase
VDSTPDQQRFANGAWHSGRGTARNPANRFERTHTARDPDDAEQWNPQEQSAPSTTFTDDRTRSVITYNDSPDIPFNASLNPYRGCEHGCSYCYARPYHEYLGLSAGLDFESRILVKREAPDLLRAELSSPAWKPQVLNLSGVTDCYQPAERTFRVTRACLEVLAEFRNPVAIITKNRLVTRDIDVLQDLARDHAAAVTISLTSLKQDLAAALEPRASMPRARLAAIRALADAGIPVTVNVAPLIPGLNDHEMPAILQAAADHGACAAAYSIVRLPHAVQDLFSDWLDRHAPAAKNKIMSAIASCHDGKLSGGGAGQRMRGSGPLAQLIGDQFRLYRTRHGLTDGWPTFSTAAFRSPHGRQQSIFDFLGANDA